MDMSTPFNSTSRSGPQMEKSRPARYSARNPRRLTSTQRQQAYMKKFLWRPASGPEGLPQTSEAKEARIDKLFAAMTDFSDVHDSNNAFTEGRLISDDDIEYACIRIAESIDKLHRYGLSVPHIADPTMKEIFMKGKKSWRIDQEERDLTASEREDAIAEHLRHYKKACLDAIAHDKELEMLFVAAPNSSGRKRDCNAASNARRKRHFPTTSPLENDSNKRHKQLDTKQSPCQLRTPTSGSVSEVTPEFDSAFKELQRDLAGSSSCKAKSAVTSTLPPAPEFVSTDQPQVFPEFSEQNNSSMPYFSNFDMGDQAFDVSFDSNEPAYTGELDLNFGHGSTQVNPFCSASAQVPGMTASYDFAANWNAEEDLFANMGDWTGSASNSLGGLIDPALSSSTSS